MSRARKVALISAIVVVALILLLAGTVFVFTDTKYGRERVRTFAVGLLKERIRGGVSVQRIEGNLLGRFSLVGVRIGDEPGNPFLVADRITARLAVRSLLSKQILIPELTLQRPVIRVTKRPGEPWNASRLLLTKEEAAANDTTPGFGDWIELRDVSLEDGTLIVQQPWSPDPELTPAAQDSATRAALEGKARARVDRADYGLRQTMDFTQIQGRFRTIVVAHPDSNVIALPGARVSMIAAPFQPPVAHIRELAGDLRVGDDSVTMQPMTLRLPASDFGGSLLYRIETGDIVLALDGRRVAFDDLRVLYPPLPEEGGGHLTLKAAIRADSLPSEYVVRDAALRTGATTIAGALGLVLHGDTTAFHDTDLRIANFPTSLLERLVPGTKVPTRGVLDGRATLSGPLSAMRVDVDGSFDPARSAPFTFAARGGVGAGDVVTMEQLFVRVHRLPMGFVHEFAPSVPLGGVLDATATVSGSPSARLAGRFDVSHRENGAFSRVTGRGSVDTRGRMPTDVTLHFAPVALAAAQRIVGDSLQLRGVVRGDATIVGDRDAMKMRLALALPEGGLRGEGTFGLDPDDPRYRASFHLDSVNVQAMVPSMPITAISGDASVDGHGKDPATLVATASAALRDVVVDSTAVDEVALRAAAREGGLTVDTLGVRLPFATATAKGTLGLTDGRDGTLTYLVDVTSLAGLERWIGAGDTTSVPIRPGVRARALAARARADSVSEQSALDSMDIAAQLAAEGKRPRQGRRRRMERAIPALAALPADSTSGAIRARGELTGRLQRFSTRGTMESGPLTWNGNALQRAKVEYEFLDARTPEARATGIVALDSVRASGFAFDSAHVKALYRLNGEGNVELSIFPRDTSEYRVNAEYSVRTGEGEVRLRDLSLRIDSTTWRTTHGSEISWKGQGVTVDSLELRTASGGGRIFVNGEMPDADPGRLDVAIDSLRIAPWLDLLQSDVPADGDVAFHGRLEGTRTAPRLNGDLALLRAVYDSVAFPDVRTKFAYADRKLTFDGDLRRDEGSLLAVMNGELPVDLSLGDSVAKRTVDGPIRVDLRGDSIPLAPLAQASGGSLTDVDGEAAGFVRVRGTWAKPDLQGDLHVAMDHATIAATGVTARDGSARVRMAENRLRIDTLVARSGGTITGGGIILLDSLTHPVLDLRLGSREALLLDNEIGELYVTSDLAIKGPLDTLAVTGRANITRGVVWIPDPATRDVIQTGDPAVFAVVDTATARQLDLDVGPPATSNMSVDVDLTVSRGVWARSLDANVEVYGELGVRLTPPDELPALTGALYTDQGDYTFLGRRFVVSRGSVRFTGAPELNPVLQVLANYEVRQAGRPPLDIRIVIGGTLEQPKLTLESDAQPQLSQSDLISFLAFGRSSTSLLALQGSGVSGGGSGGASLAGNVAAMATRQLATIALDALVDEIEGELTDALRADRLNITPANIPAELTAKGLGTILRGTEIEIGKYLDRRTFLSADVRPTATIPGLTVERRLTPQLRLRTSYETRYLPTRPTLTAGIDPKTLNVIGATLTWTLGW